MDPAMTVDTTAERGPEPEVASLEDPPAVPARRIEVALGRRVEVIGDLILPAVPSPSSTAACRDVARRLGEWQGPGTVVICGQLVATSPGETADAAAVLGAHVELTEALAKFATRPDSQVCLVAPLGEADRRRPRCAPSAPPSTPPSNSTA